MQRPPALPAIESSRGLQRRLWIASIAAASLAFGVLASRLASQIDLWQWWVPVALAGGVLIADFSSGLVHWGADTWGRDDLPVIGPRLLVPFRVHHINPSDFLERSFADTNGDLALMTVGPLLALTQLPLTNGRSAFIAVAGLAFCGAIMLTNQVHQWAHVPSPPRIVRLLQDSGLILGRREHAVHHDRPYDAHYCITTGWCNRPLQAISFFRRLERAIAAVTGARPRHDDERYERRYGYAATLLRND